MKLSSDCAVGGLARGIIACCSVTPAPWFAVGFFPNERFQGRDVLPAGGACEVLEQFITRSGVRGDAKR